MWSISQSRDTKDRKLKAIKYSVHDTRHQEGYDEEELLHMQTTSGKEEQEDYEPEQDSWQISHLVSADTFGAGHDAGDVQTERIKITWSMIMWQPLACGLYPG